MMWSSTRKTRSIIFCLESHREMQHPPPKNQTQENSNTSLRLLYLTYISANLWFHRTGLARMIRLRLFRASRTPWSSWWNDPWLPVWKLVASCFLLGMTFYTSITGEIPRRRVLRRMLMDFGMRLTSPRKKLWFGRSITSTTSRRSM